MKFVEPSTFADPDVAARKLVEIANAVEAVQDGRIFIERVNGPFLADGGTPDQYHAALARDQARLAVAARVGDVCEVHPGRRRAVCLMTRMALVALAALILVPASAAAADNMTGQASIIDADTLEIHGARIRLWGIDAPESSQLCRGEDSLQYRCGAKAANDLDAFIARRPVNCVPITLDRYGRTVASCAVDRTDLAEWLVGNGLAIDWPKYSKGKFDPIQRKAEHAGRGMWAGSYVEPWLYRVCVRAARKPADCSDDANAHP
jgi:endonuclease YncB( thermonuclease family)